MISFEMAKRLKEAGVIIDSEYVYDTDKHIGNTLWNRKEHAAMSILEDNEVTPAPSFEELWSALPPFIIHPENGHGWLHLEKLKRYSRIVYKDINRNNAIEVDNSVTDKITLSDLAAELLIELKNRGML